MTEPFAEERPRRRLARAVRAAAVLMLLVLAAVAAAAVWVGFAVRDVQDGVAHANARVDAGTRAALAPAGDPLEETQTTLVIGRGGRGRALSALLLRTDPRARRVTTLILSPRLSADVLRFGGARLVPRLSDALRVPIHHIVSIDVAALGPLVAQTGPVLGRDAAAAIAFARGGGDPARAAAAQARLLESIARSLLRPSALLDARELAPAVTAPIAATDLSAGDLARLAWVRAEATERARCRLSEGLFRRATLRAFRSGARGEATCTVTALDPPPLPTRSAAVSVAVAYLVVLVAALIALFATTGLLRLELRPTPWGELPYARVSLAGGHGPAINVLAATLVVFAPLLALQAMLAFR